MFFYDPTFLLLIPAFIFTLWAQARVKGAFAKYSQVRAASGMTGHQVASELLTRGDLLTAVEQGSSVTAIQAHNQLSSVQVALVSGELSDHYDPRERVLRLSEPVYGSNSLAALGVAAHETGHAVQHAIGYGPLAIRSTLVPAAQFGSTLAWPLFLIGFFLGGVRGLPLGHWLMDAGIILFAGAVLFTLITLPVEFNASKRALAMLERGGYVTTQEMPAVRAVLGAAALTYVAAAAMAVIQLLRLLMLRERD